MRDKWGDWVIPPIGLEAVATFFLTFVVFGMMYLAPGERVKIW